MREKIIVAMLCIPLLAARADARCGVACNREFIVQEQFIAVPTAVALGVPVASYGAVGYSYTPSPIINVNVPPTDYAAMSQAVQVGVTNALNASGMQQPVGPPAPIPSPVPVPQPIPAPPPQPIPAPIPQPPVVTPPSPTSNSFPQPAARGVSMVAEKCAKCHGGQNANATSALDTRVRLTSEQRLSAIRAVLSEKMPKGNPMKDPDQAGQLISELTAP